MKFSKLTVQRLLRIIFILNLRYSIKIKLSCFLKAGSLPLNNQLVFFIIKSLINVALLHKCQLTFEREKFAHLHNDSKKLLFSDLLHIHVMFIFFFFLFVFHVPIFFYLSCFGLSTLTQKNHHQKRSFFNN